MFIRIIIIIGVLALIGFSIWYFVAKGNPFKNTGTQTAQSLPPLRIPVLMHPTPNSGLIGTATSTVATSSSTPVTATTPPAPVPVSSNLQQAGCTTQTAQQQEFSTPTQEYKNMQAGFTLRIPAGSTVETDSRRLIFRYCNQPIPYGYVEVFSRDKDTLDSIEQRIKNSVDRVRVERAIVGGQPAVFYQAPNWQKNGLAIVVGDRLYFVYGALLKNSIRSTFSF